MKALLILLSVLVGINAHADRIQIPTFDQGIQLDAFVYGPNKPMTMDHGVILFIGGSGYTHGGFGGPAKFAKAAAENGYYGIEWNKRGIETKPDLSDITVSMDVYRTAIFENLLRDAEAVVDFVRARFPDHEIYVVGGSEGSLVTTRLAERRGNQIKAIATFGTVAGPFIEIVGMQLMDQVVNPHWKELDIDGDGVLSKDEYKPAAFGIEGLFLQTIAFERIDVSKNQMISQAEMEQTLLNHFLNEQTDPDYWLKASGVPSITALLEVPALFDRARNIKQPYLLLHGEDDNLTPVKSILELEVYCRKLGIRNFNFGYFAGVGHAPSDAMFQQILTFFAGVTNSLRTEF